MRLTKKVAKLLDRERVCRVASAGSSRVPHLVPVCFAVSDGKLYFGSERKARKVQNLRANPHAALTVDLYSDDWSHLKGVMVQGSAALIERGPRFRKLRRLLYDKYPPYSDEAALKQRESVIVEITPRHVFSWGLE